MSDEGICYQAELAAAEAWFNGHDADAWDEDDDDGEGGEADEVPARD